VLQICKRPPTSIGITNSVNLIVHLSNHHSNFKTILLLIRKSFSSNHNPVCSVSMIFHRASWCVKQRQLLPFCQLTPLARMTE
jgi:hypothetical protein